MSSESPPAVRSRDPERTRGEILEAALAHFATHGFEGAKVQRIAESAGCNPRLIYHYYESKERLYLEVLRHIYAEIRTREQDLQLEALPPARALDRLVGFTFDFFEGNAAFLAITRSENLLGGRFIARMPEIQKISAPFLDKIAGLLARGHREGAFRGGVDPLQLYASIVALSAHHLNACHTMSATFGRDIGHPDWRRARRAHVVDLIGHAVCLPESSTIPSEVVDPAQD